MRFASRISWTPSLKVMPLMRHRLAFVEAERHLLPLHLDVVTPVRDAHDRLDDLHAGVESFEILRLVSGAEDVRVGGVGLLGLHAVLEAGSRHVRRHLRAAAQFVDELLIEPRLVDLQVGIREQAVAIEALDVVPFEGAAVPPDVDVVLTHGADEHRAGDRAADRSGVEVRDACRGDMERTALEHGDPFRDELLRGSRSAARARRRTRARVCGMLS